jgi:hypothetical protein
MHEYGDDFYAFLSSFAVRSAQTVVPIVLAATAASNVADFGCGQGAWLSVWKSAGLEVQGVDGPYVDQSRLLIPQAQFTPADLAQPINLGRRFDLVQSLETAEHLPASSAAEFVATLAEHADRVLFSAAVPGQGGEHHINERSLEYWRGLFRTQGFVAVDLVRPAVRDNINVQIWYRCNTILYVRSSVLPSISPAARALVVPDEIALASYWPLRDRLVQAVIRQLPVAIVDLLSRVNARRYTRKEAVLS